MKIIAHIESEYKEKFGIPRQSGLAPSTLSCIVFENEYRNPDAIRGLEEFTHLWLIWEFSENKAAATSLTVRPPRLGGNIRKGVFATRSPFRPNPIGLSSVKIEKIELETNKGPVIYISGADLLNKTPIYDIKPYIYADCHQDAVSGFAEKTKDRWLEVVWPEALAAVIDGKLRKALTEVLRLDPRPGYQEDEERVYGMVYGDLDVKFRVAGEILTVVNVEKCKYNE